MIRHLVEHEFDQFVSKSAKQLVILDFWASWCKPCGVMEPIMENISRRFTMTVEILKVDVDNEERLAKAAGIQSVPTMVFFKPGNPQPIYKHSGVMSEVDLPWVN